MSFNSIFPMFIAESKELLATAEEALLLLEQCPDSNDAIAATFRAVHTIKGSAGALGLDRIVGFSHVMENVLDRARNNEITITKNFTDLCLKCIDYVNHLIDLVEPENLDIDVTDAAELFLLQQLSYFSTITPPNISLKPVVDITKFEEISNERQWKIIFNCGPNTFRHGMDPISFIRYLFNLGNIIHLKTTFDQLPEESMDPETCYLNFEIYFISTASKQEIQNVFKFLMDDSEVIVEEHQTLDCQNLIIDQRLKETTAAKEIIEHSDLADISEKQKIVSHVKTNSRQFVRVDARKLDALIDEVGEMVIAAASATLLAKNYDNATLLEAMSFLNRQMEAIRDSALTLRTIEIGETFRRFNRIVRDVGKELNKEVTLELEGEETELDKTVVEKISDPLMHLVRNAIDHGIETQEIRIAKSKPHVGKLKLSARHESGSVVIEISDDGGGLKREKILAKAIERRLVEPGKNLSESEIFNLIFEPGFSTAEVVTNISGRGVGMDVVKRNINELRGTINITSQESIGTTVTIRLPLTLAIINGFMVSVGDNVFILPLDMVEECMEFNQSFNNDYIDLRGNVLPFICLRKLFEIKTKETDRKNIVVVKYAGQKMGLVVDSLLGEHQTVIKPLSTIFSGIKCISGSTILGTGDVGLIVDVPAILNHMTREQAPKQREQKTAVESNDYIKNV